MTNAKNTGTWAVDNKRGTRIATGVSEERAEEIAEAYEKRTGRCAHVYNAPAEDSDAGLIAAHAAARDTFNTIPTVENERAWAKAQNVLHDYQKSMGLGFTVRPLDLRADGTVKKFGE